MFHGASSISWIQRFVIEVVCDVYFVFAISDFRYLLAHIEHSMDYRFYEYDISSMKCVIFVEIVNVQNKMTSSISCSSFMYNNHIGLSASISPLFLIPSHPSSHHCLKHCFMIYPKRAQTHSHTYSTLNDDSQSHTHTHSYIIFCVVQLKIS